MGEILKQGISYRGIFPKSFVRRVDDAQEDFHDRPWEHIFLLIQ